MYLSLVKRKIKTILPIFKILLFPSQDFSDLNFDIICFIFRLNIAELCNFKIQFSLYKNFQVLTDHHIEVTMLTKTQQSFVKLFLLSGWKI